MTQKENLNRSPKSPHRRTHCAQGHPYDAANTHVDKQGKKHCRACDRERHAAAYARRKQS